MMMLLNGLLCLASAIILLIQIKKSQDKLTNQLFQKFIWLYWSVLMIISIHHLCTAISYGHLNSILNKLTPITDSLLAVLGVILAYCMFKQPEKILTK